MPDMISDTSDRRLSPEQAQAMCKALQGSGLVAIFATDDRERIQFAADIAQVFAKAGWTVMIRENSHLYGGPRQSKAAPLVNIADNFDGPAGVFLPVYIGSDIERSEVNRIVEAFSGVGLKVTAIDCDRSTPSLRGDLHSIYFVPITTAVPVVFVGANSLGK